MMTEYIQRNKVTIHISNIKFAAGFPKADETYSC